MFSKRNGSVLVAAALLAALVGAGALVVESNEDKEKTERPTPIGAWFGLARACTLPNGILPPPGTDDQSICEIACNGPCPANSLAFPFQEVTMIPTLLADRTVLADDFAELLGYHTTAHGRWEFQGKVRVDGREVDKYQATFIWFAPGSTFDGSLKPRFVTFFDRHNPDVMRGYIQPYLYQYTDASGTVQLQPGTPFPTPDVVAPLPEACDPADELATPRCFGTLHFVIRRIQSH
jgi:hypothetical protein